MRSIKAEQGAAPSSSATTGTQASKTASLPPPPSIAGYRVLEQIGRGGMARVLRVADSRTGREIALKQLQIDNERRRQQGAVLFEREFHTLVQLSHPRVIEVYDYGIADGNPYYTMELLDGGDLRARSPMPWRDACELLFDVCSSLALLHSRRLVHRDITPRNVRCTHAGRAKLIDFGAMVPMGPGRQGVGTPGFVAPEVMQRSALDARTDLYSLGATLYYALTGRAPYFARELGAMVEAWRSPPPPPSSLAKDVPVELDRLVMSMLSVEPALRPRGAYEVMQRLIAIAGIERDEPASVAQAYLATPLILGREEPLAAFRRHMQRVLRGAGGAVLVEAGPGLGRSRMLDAFAIEAKLLGAVVLRAGNSAGLGGRLGVAARLVDQLAHALPQAALAYARELDAAGSVFELPQLETAAEQHAAAAPAPASLSLRAYPEAPAAQLAYQSALGQWFLRASRGQPLLIAVDDIDQLDDASVALLASLAHRSRRERVLLALTAERAIRPASAALEVLAGQSTKLLLRPLDRTETETLLTSVFGDVPNVNLLAERIHAVALGRPRECMTIAQHLIERGVIVYAGGSWTLPAQLAASDLPTRAEDVYRARAAALQPRARRLAQLQSLAFSESFTREDYGMLEAGAAPEQVDAAVAELLAHEIVRKSGGGYTLANRAVRAALLDLLQPAERVELHRALAELCERTARPKAAAVSHLFEAGVEERALDLLMQAITEAVSPQVLEVTSRMSVADLAVLIERAVEAASRLPRSPFERCELNRWLFLFSLVTDERVYYQAAPALLVQLERDSGLAFYRALDGVADPMQRLMQALQRAGEQYAATPERERIYPVDEAIKNLVYYVVISIAVGARTFDGELIASLPPLLEPFAPLSPVLGAMWQNALATFEVSVGRPEQAHDRWRALYAQLEHVDEAQLQGVDLIRNAIAYGLGAIDAQIGRDSVGHWASILDRDPLQQVSAMYLRKTLCLHRGDFQSAERFRRKAEVLSVQSTIRQMFSNTLVVELSIAALIRDLTGVKQIGDRIAPLAAQHTGWKPYGHLARAHFHRLRGDLPLARAECERAFELVAVEGRPERRTIMPWVSVAVCYIETLLEMERYEEARAFGLQALASCAELGVGRMADEIARPLALAEGKLGDLPGAAARLDTVIAAQQGYEAHGLILGATYEARTRIAIWAGDRPAVEEFGQLAAREYRFGRHSPLGARYEQLLHEAKAAGMQALPQLDSFGSTHIGTTSLGGGGRATVETSVTAAFRGADHPAARAEVALGLLCEAHAARGGHLYVLRDDGLVLACSQAATPDDELELALRKYWQRHVLDADQATPSSPRTRRIRRPRPIRGPTAAARATSRR